MPQDVMEFVPEECEGSCQQELWEEEADTGKRDCSCNVKQKSKEHCERCSTEETKYPTFRTQENGVFSFEEPHEEPARDGGEDEPNGDEEEDHGRVTRKAAKAEGQEGSPFSLLLRRRGWGRGRDLKEEGGIREALEDRSWWCDDATVVKGQFAAFCEGDIGTEKDNPRRDSLRVPIGREGELGVCEVGSNGEEEV